MKSDINTKENTHQSILVESYLETREETMRNVNMNL